MVSYSGPSVRYSTPSIIALVSLLHPIGHAKQAWGRRKCLRKASAEISEAYSEVFSCQFLDGSVPVSWVKWTVIMVPSVGKVPPLFVNGCSAIFFRQRLATSLKPFSSAIGKSPSPRMTTAFRFFEPITAPAPPRPYALLALMILANRTRFSPACPMVATLIFSFSFCFRSPFKRSSVSEAEPPQRWSAPLMDILSFSTRM